MNSSTSIEGNLDATSPRQPGDVQYLMSPLEQERLLSRLPVLQDYLQWLREFPTVEAPILVLPDVSVGKWGVPSGFVIRTHLPEALVLPTAVSDAGCGFRLLRLRIDKAALGPEDIFCLVELIDQYLGPSSAIRLSAADDINMVGVFSQGSAELIHCGVEGAESLFLAQNASDKPLNSLDRLPGNDTFIYWARKGFGRYAGHFFTVRRVVEVFPTPSTSVDILVGDYILLIHSGAMFVRECVKQQLYYKMAEEAVRNGLIKSAEALRHGVFALPSSSDIGAAFLAATRIMENYATASRHMASCLLLRALTEFSRRRAIAFELQPLSDACHSSLSELSCGMGKSLVHRRGVQMLHPTRPESTSDPTVFAVCASKETPAYLVVAGQDVERTFGYLNHGIPPELGLIEDAPPPSDVVEQVMNNLNSCYFDTPPAIDSIAVALGNLLHLVRYLEISRVIDPVAVISPVINLEKHQV